MSPIPNTKGHQDNDESSFNLLMNSCQSYDQMNDKGTAEFTAKGGRGTADFNR